MNLLLHYKLYGDIDVQEYKLYGDVDKKFNKCLMQEGEEIVVKEYPVPEFINCTLMQKGDEGFYEYKDFCPGENAELSGGMQYLVLCSRTNGLIFIT